MNPRVHEECNSVMIHLIPSSNPQTSEWYCGKCHYSESMTPDEVNYWSMLKKAPAQPTETD